jgi:hypothetical protein
MILLGEELRQYPGVSFLGKSHVGFAPLAKGGTFWLFPVNYKRSGETLMQEAEIKRLMKNLGETIKETLAESPKITARLQEIRDVGYETFLVIEAKIGFSRNDSEECDIASDFSDEPVRLKITPEDAKFLKSLKISSD